ncbi:unnamed protein product [Adineta steineri]|uniref:G-protein coupled receptors family 1 profile domain-containing protein n=1 Tax=Adineta steineri TaxID=433720 RepID=A0A813XRA4_9BILA|nr:unnamed protein product [Adineta steineri]CAF1033220.1 unnamed protein product [Adineta steineri]CAF3513256.1 unnamed protein product [Adineta steineri]CAF3594721.1 unnamed protein product [Adineta steineri]
MSSPYILQINFIIEQMNIYVALVIFITGIIGGLLNIIIFTSLKTFRRTSCGFYLTVTSIFNVGQTLSALSTRILDSGFSIDLTNVSWSCKIRTFLAQSCVLLSLTSMSLVTIDQFISMTRYKHFSNLRLAHRHIIISCCIWCFHGIFVFLYWDAPNGRCTSLISLGYEKYLSYFYLPVLLGCLPIFIMITFSLLAFIKIRTLASRQINIVRLSRDRQLTAMALSQVAFTVFVSLPYTIFNIYDLNTVTTNQDEYARLQLIGTVTVLLYYENFASSFYIFCCVSKRFRKQFIYVIFKIHLNWLRKLSNNLKSNQIAPSMELSIDGQIGKANVTIHDVSVQTS